MPRKAAGHVINWTVVLFLAGLAVTTMTTLGAFYWGTNATLAEHEKQMKRLGDEFKGFGETSKQNFDKWLSINKAEQEKAERIAKEDREAREKVRDSLTQFITAMTTKAASTDVKVDLITKQLDKVQGVLDGVSTVQQENRNRLIGNQGRR
jgi:predicted RNA-binding protein Jag